MPPRKGSANKNRTTVQGHQVQHVDQFSLDDPRWQTFLNHPDTKSFSFMLPDQPDSLITVRRENLRGGQYWYAYKWHQKRLHKVYMGKSEEIDHEALMKAVAALQAKISGGSIED